MKVAAGPPSTVVRMATRASVVVVALSVVSLSVPVAVAARQGQEPPRVLVIATGGTIAGQSQGGQLTGAQLVEAVPELADVAQIEVEEFSRIGSSAMTPDRWLRLSRSINARFESDRSLAGIVVTHGTDTMEETGYFLHLTVRHERPVVMVGSMRNASAVSADGPANLLSGVRVAASRQAWGLGVLVVLNDEVHSARDVRKTDNNRVDTFVSAEWGALGVVDADRIVFRRAMSTRHTVISDLHVAPEVEVLPDVPIVTDYAGNDGSVLRRTMELGPAAVVVQAFGGGRASPDMRRAISDAAEAGVPIVLTSRVPQGRVMGSSEAVASGIVSAGDLPAHKARVLAMLALLKGYSGSELQRLYDSH